MYLENICRKLTTSFNSIEIVNRKYLSLICLYGFVSACVRITYHVKIFVSFYIFMLRKIKQFETKFLINVQLFIYIAIFNAEFLVLIIVWN